MKSGLCRSRRSFGSVVPPPSIHRDSLRKSNSGDPGAEFLSSTTGWLALRFLKCSSRSGRIKTSQGHPSTSLGVADCEAYDAPGMRLLTF